jgi:tetratricopeptide (TPR) repeat protein
LKAADEAGDEALRLRTIVGRSYSRYYVDGPSAVDRDAVRLATERLRASREVGRAHYLLGVVAKDRGQLDEAVTHLEQAKRTWAEFGLDGSRSSAVNELASVARLRGRNEEAERLFGEAARLSERVGRLTNAAISHVNRVRAARECGVTEGLVETLERSIRTLRLEGVRHTAGHVGNILATARISAGDLDGALAAIEAAQDDVAGSGFLHAVTDLRITHAFIAGMRGHLREAWGFVDEARESIRRSEKVQASLQLAGIEMVLRCWGGEHEAAALTARRAVAAAGELDPRARADLAVAIAEATLYGLPPPIGREGRALLAVEPGAFGAWAEAVVDGALALHDETAETRGPSDRLLGPDIAHEVTGSRILGRWLAAEAERRAGQPDWAEREARTALHAARDFGHVWLQAALLRYLDRLTGDDAHRTQLQEIVAAAATELDDEGAARLRAAWLSSPNAGG